MGTHMKTTIDISDALFAEAKDEAARRGVTLRSLVEEGLERVLRDAPSTPFVLRDCSVGGGWSDAWEAMTPAQKTAAMYGEPG